MATNLTDVDEFTAAVAVPEDTDPANAASLVQGFQPLANRTLNLKNRLDASDDAKVTAGVAIYDIETSAGSTYQELTEVFADSGFTIVSDATGHRVQVPAAGAYLVTWLAPMVTSSTGSNPTVELFMSVAATLHSALRQRSGTSAATEAYPGDTRPVQVTTPATDLIGITVGASAGTPSLTRSGRLTITRVSA